VALKIFLPAFSNDEEAVRRFIRAAKTLARMHNIHLVDLNNAGRVDGYCWLSMELIEGPSVAWLVRQAALEQGDWRVGLRVLHHVTRGLIFLHNNQILHRNLTPENLLTNRADGLVKIGDLITAKAKMGKFAQTVTAEGSLVGDVRYLAPERTAGEPGGDYRSDLYALGAIVYAVLIGRPPLEGGNTAEAIRKVCEDMPVPPRQLRPDIPPDLDSVVMRLLAKEPGRRFNHATELLHHLVQHRLID
jgi:serine/threonine protein kinase